MAFAKRIDQLPGPQRGKFRDAWSEYQRRMGYTSAESTEDKPSTPPRPAKVSGVVEVADSATSPPTPKRSPLPGQLSFQFDDHYPFGSPREDKP